jgi:hypothetical protein
MGLNVGSTNSMMNLKLDCNEMYRGCMYHLFFLLISYKDMIRLQLLYNSCTTIITFSN